MIYEVYDIDILLKANLAVKYRFLLLKSLTFEQILANEPAERKVYLHPEMGN